MDEYRVVCRILGHDHWHHSGRVYQSKLSAERAMWYADQSYCGPHRIESRKVSEWEAAE